MKKWSTPKAIKSKKIIDKGLKKLGKSLGLDKPFSAAITFDDTNVITTNYTKTNTAFSLAFIF